MKPIEWITGGDTGTSSKTIWAVMMGGASEGGRYDVPYDPDDFGRCYRLLQQFPEWRSRLNEVAERFPEWTGLVREWDNLAAIYEKEAPTRKCSELYAAMRPLIDEGRRAAGWVQTSPNGWMKGKSVSVILGDLAGL